MSADIKKIEKLLKETAELKKMVLKNQLELKAIKNHLFKIAKPLPVGAYVHTDTSYEWGTPSIKITPTNWKKIKAGEHLKIRGQGWRFNDYFNEVSDEQFFHWDYWDFQGGKGKPLIVTMRSKEYGDEVIYDGDLYSSMIQEFKIKPKE